MKFNLGASNKVQEIRFSSKVSKPFHPDIHFNNNLINLTSFQKYLEMILDPTLICKEYRKFPLVKVNKTIGLIRKFHLHRSKNRLLTV